ncbi:hypothetical protein M1O56_02975 [Dehalococcoidia bacterium]|nr:hypothetical protein [Dehalococcoidia bacterium]
MLSLFFHPQYPELFAARKLIQVFSGGPKTAPVVVDFYPHLACNHHDRDYAFIFIPTPQFIDDFSDFLT